MKLKLLIFILFLGIGSCRKEYHAPVPDFAWDLFDSPASGAIPHQSRQPMEGIYSVSEGAGIFGDKVALKWSFVIEGTDTAYHLSVFSGQGVAYFIMEGKRSGDSLLFNGYWRKLSNTQTGIARFVVNASNGATELLKSSPVISTDSITMEGLYGDNGDQPTRKIVFKYLRPLYHARPFEILAHRSGGRTSDLLPVSENSVGMIKFAEELGATGIEIDVRYTLDKVPILYHDNTLNLRLIQKNGLVGPIKNYTYDQLNTFVRLLDGQKIPTLREALEAVVYNTSLHFVWLDTKYDDSVDRVSAIQQEYLQKAAAAGRQLQIVIGLPDDASMNHFLALPDFSNIPSLCELSLDDVKKVNADYWAPRFTLGLQNDQVASVHADGRKVFVWTLDEPDLITQFINEGDFDGVLSNYASLVAYNYYVRE